MGMFFLLEVNHLQTVFQPTFGLVSRRYVAWRRRRKNPWHKNAPTLPYFVALPSRLSCNGRHRSSSVPPLSPLRLDLSLLFFFIYLKVYFLALSVRSFTVRGGHPSMLPINTLVSKDPRLY